MTNEQYTEVLDDEGDFAQDEEASQPVSVQKLVTIARVVRQGRKQLHLAWEPASFKQVFNKDVYAFRKDDLSHDYLTSHTADGRLMGGSTQFGQVSSAFKELDLPLTTNDAMATTHADAYYKVIRVREEYVKTNDRETVAREIFNAGFKDLTKDQQAEVLAKAPKSGAFFVKPLERLDDYEPPAQPRVVRYGFKTEAEGVSEAISPAQLLALRDACDGEPVTGLINAIIDSGNPIIMCDPFMREAGNGTLVERLTKLGAKVDEGVVVF